MAEQLILKGTLEGHVSRPSRCHFFAKQFRTSDVLQPLESYSWQNPTLELSCMELTMGFAEWLGHGLGHLD